MSNCSSNCFKFYSLAPQKEKISYNSFLTFTCSTKVMNSCRPTSYTVSYIMLYKTLQSITSIITLSFTYASHMMSQRF